MKIRTKEVFFKRPFTYLIRLNVETAGRAVRGFKMFRRHSTIGSLTTLIRNTKAARMEAGMDKCTGCRTSRVRFTDVELMTSSFNCKVLRRNHYSYSEMQF